MCVASMSGSAQTGRRTYATFPLEATSEILSAWSKEAMARYVRRVVGRANLLTYGARTIYLVRLNSYVSTARVFNGGRLNGVMSRSGNVSRRHATARHGCDRLPDFDRSGDPPAQRPRVSSAGSDAAQGQARMRTAQTGDGPMASQASQTGACGTRARHLCGGVKVAERPKAHGT